LKQEGDLFFRGEKITKPRTNPKRALAGSKRLNS